jgi:hypothetical protein
MRAVAGHPEHFFSRQRSWPSARPGSGHPAAHICSQAYLTQASSFLAQRARAAQRGDHLAGCFGTPCCCCGCCCGCCCMPWPIGSTNPPMCIGCPCGPHICRADARSVVRTHARASAARRHTVLARRAEKKRPGLDTGTLCPVTRALPQHFCRLWPRPRVLCPGCAAALLPSWAATPGIVPGLCRSTAAVCSASRARIQKSSWRA